MDHRAVVASLSKEQRQELTTKSDLKGLVGLAVHAGAVALAGVFIATGQPFWQVMLVIQGILIVFLFTLMHEAIHRTAFATLKLNDAVAWICGVVLLLPPTWFRYFHFAHHRHTQDPENDPELSAAKPETTGQYIKHISGLPIWLGAVKTLVINATGQCEEKYIPQSARRAVQLEAIFMIAVYAVCAFVSLLQQSTLLLNIWIIPALLGQPFLRLYLLAEHGRCAFVANMFENTRTTFTNVLVRQLAWNMPYHTEHHVYPTVPFHQLPKLHELVQQHLTETENGYARFNKAYVDSLKN